MLYPDSRKTRLVQIGRIIEEKRLNEARQMLQTYLNQYPKDAEALYLASGLIDDPQTQIDILSKALKFDPNHRLAWQKLNAIRLEYPDLKYVDSFPEPIDQPVLSAPIRQIATLPRRILVFLLIGLAGLAGLLTLGYLLAPGIFSRIRPPLPTQATFSVALIATDTPIIGPSATLTATALLTTTRRITLSLPYVVAATNTARSTVTNVATSTAINTAISTATDTAISTVTNTATSTSTETAMSTLTNTATSIATNTELNTAINTAIDTATTTAISTAANTAMSTLTNTLTSTATETAAPIATKTPGLTPSSTPFGAGLMPINKDNLRTVTLVTTLRIAGKGALLKIAFGPDDSHLAVANGGARAADVWDFEANREAASFDGTATADIAYGSDLARPRVATTSVTDNTAHVWDAPTGSALYKVVGHTAAVRAVAFSPDGKLLATGAADATVRLWKADTGEPLVSLATSVVVDGVTFNASSSILAAGLADGTIQIWGIANRDKPQLLKTLRHASGASGAMFVRFFGNTLASTNGSSVIFWDSSWAPVRIITTPEGSRGVALNPGLQLFALAGGDGMVRIGSLNSGAILLTLKGSNGQPVQSVAFSPDGKILASGATDGTVRLWTAG